jgi:hypothetical protein
MANEEYALSEPDPMAKIADAAGGAAGVPYLMVAVGGPLEWDFAAPYFGRRQIVRGAVYSYYEFQSDKLMDDKEWREALPKRRRPEWVTRFMSPDAASCPAKDPY